MEIVDRALTGPFCKERDFELNVFSKRLREVVKEHDIRYDQETLITSDNTLADEVFEAGLELYSECGTYCVDTHRIIKFDEGEIKEGLREVSPSVKFGEGKFEKKLEARKPESDLPPWCSVGAAGISVSDADVFASLMRSYAEIPYADSITTPSLSKVNGREIIANTPLEVLGAIKTIELSKEAVKAVNKPGLPIVNAIASAMTASATIAGSHFGLKTSDAFEIGCAAPMKADLNLLNKVFYATRTENKILAGASPLMGGFSGGPEGVAVANVAYAFQGLMVQRGDVYHPYPLHFMYTCNSERRLLWAISISTQALARNTHYPLLNLGYAASGPTSRMIFYEAAAWAITSVVSGASVEVLGMAKGTNIDHLSPIEPMFAAEVARKAVGKKRADANILVKKLLQKYEDKLGDPPIGKKYQECFDIKSRKPIKEYEELYEEVKKEMEEFGVL